jgi:hypothetical protein
MLEWKPKLITLILALAILAMLVGLLHPGFLGTGSTNIQWGLD